MGVCSLCRGQDHEHVQPGRHDGPSPAAHRAYTVPTCQPATTVWVNHWHPKQCMCALHTAWLLMQAHCTLPIHIEDMQLQRVADWQVGREYSGYTPQYIQGVLAASNIKRDSNPVCHLAATYQYLLCTATASPHPLTTPPRCCITTLCCRACQPHRHA